MNLIRMRTQGVAFGDLAMIENIDGERSLAKAVEDLDRDIASLQVFAGDKGLSTYTARELWFWRLSMATA